MFVHILKNCLEKGVNSRSIMLATEISHDVLSLTILHCFVASIYGKWFPWEFTDKHTLTGGRGDFHVWLTRYVCSVR